MADGFSDGGEFGVVCGVEVVGGERHRVGGGADRRVVSGGVECGGDQLYAGREPRDGDGVHHHRQPDGGGCGADLFLLYRDASGYAFFGVVLDDTEADKPCVGSALLCGVGDRGVAAADGVVFAALQGDVVLPVGCGAAADAGEDYRLHFFAWRG